MDGRIDELAAPEVERVAERFVNQTHGPQNGELHFAKSCVDPKISASYRSYAMQLAEFVLACVGEY